MVPVATSGSVLFTTKVMAGATDDGTLLAFSPLQLFILELFALLFELVLMSSQFLVLSEVVSRTPVTHREFLFPFFHRLEGWAFRTSVPTSSWRDDDSSSLVLSLFLAPSTVTTAVGGSPVPVVSVADAGA